MQHITQTPGEVTNLRQLEEDISLGILGRYAEDGYVGAYIVEFALSTLEEDAGTVYVTISEGIVEDVVFEGNEKTKESLLRMVVGRQIELGQVLQKGAVEEAMQDLYNLGIFEQVEPTMDPAPTGGNVILRFSLVEAATGQAGVGIGYSTVNGLQGTLSYSERNFQGRGRTISALVVFSKNNPGYQLDYSDPYVSEKSFFSTSLYDLNYRQQRNPDSAIESEIDVDSVGGTVTWGRRMTDELSGSVSLGLTDYDYSIIKGDPFREYGPERRRRLQQTGQTRSVTFGLTHDARDNVFVTHDGTYLSTSVQVAGFGGDFDFRKYVADGRVFLPHAEKNTVAFRAKVGLAEGNVPVFEEFRVGGVNSVRGLPEDDLTGTKMLLLNGEYRFPLDKKKTFTGVVFADAAWVGESFSETDTSYSAGVGLRFRVPALGLGSIRLDMGWDLQDGGARLHFGIGEMF
jgi:outer membrane protein insertion porin family